MIKRVESQVESSSGKKIKTFRSDNGEEYTCSEFATYWTQEGIKHEFATPHTPQQNGAAERVNCTLIEGVCAMLANLKLLHRFWAEALSRCECLQNTVPPRH